MNKMNFVVSCFPAQSRKPTLKFSPRPSGGKQPSPVKLPDSARQEFGQDEAGRACPCSMMCGWLGVSESENHPEMYSLTRPVPGRA